MTHQIKTFAAAMLAAAGLPTETTGLQVFRHEFTVLVQVHTIDEVFAAEAVAERFKAKFGWEMLVKF